MQIQLSGVKLVSLIIDMKYLLALLLACSLSAQLRIRDLPAATAVGSNTVVYGVVDPSGVPIDKKITAQQIFDSASTNSSLKGTTSVESLSLVNKLDATNVAPGTISTVEFGYLDGLDANLMGKLQSPVVTNLKHTAISALSPVFTDSDGDFTDTGEVPVAKGGTGASTAAAARINLGISPSLVAPFEHRYGGTGTTNLNGIVRGNGTTNALTGILGVDSFLPVWSGTNNFITSTIYNSGGITAFVAPGNSETIFQFNANTNYSNFSFRQGAATYIGTITTLGTNYSDASRRGAFEFNSLLGAIDFYTGAALRYKIDSAGYASIGRSLRIGSIGGTDPGDNNFLVEGTITAPALGTTGRTNIAFINSSGTFVTNALFWDDLRVPGLSTKTGATAPTFGNFVDANTQGYLFNNAQDDETFFSIQMPHSWKEGSDIYPHVHWMRTAAPGVAANTNVVWEFTYSWANVNTTFPAGTAITATNSVSGTNWFHQVSSFAAISGTGKTVSSVLNCRLRRLANTSASDTYDQDVGLIDVDIHHLVDSFGSQQEFVK